jgi:hypothetical protein
VSTAPLTIVGWLWRNEKYPVQYTPEHANVWARMIHRNLTLPHRFVLMTDQPDREFDSLIQPERLWDDWRSLRHPWGDRRPHCYVRLKAFSEEVAAIFGPRLVSVDLDCVVVGDLDPLFSRTEDFLIMRRQVVHPQDKHNTYQGSMWMMSTGVRACVWHDFKGEESIAAAKKYIGTDQAWIRYKLGPNEAGWSQTDGVYGWPRVNGEARWRKEQPEGARIVFFYGGDKPWVIASKLRRIGKGMFVARNSYRWVREHYQ